MKTRCFILDDEYFSRNILKDHIAKMPELEFVGEADDAVPAYKMIKDAATDLLFLDINMPDINGISFLESHRDLPLTIMTTAHPEHALETYKFDVVDYLLKPVSFSEFYRSVTKAKSYLDRPRTQKETGKPDYFFVKTSAGFSKIVYSELLFAEARHNFVEFHTTAGSIMAAMTFRKAAEDLNFKNFVRIHKSYIVNVDNIENIDNDEIRIAGKELPVSRSYRNDLISAIQGQIIGKP